MMDFEFAARSSYMLVIGNQYGHVLVGCVFHFGQGVIGFVRDAGFIKEFQENSCPLIWL